MSRDGIEKIRDKEHAFRLMLSIMMRLHNTPSMASKLPKEVLGQIYSIWLWVHEGGE